MSKLLLGVDVGTTNIKVGAFSIQGELRHLAKARNPVRHPKPSHAEQDMAATWTATAETLRTVTAELPPGASIAGVGTTGQAHGCWIIDEAGEPVRDAIIWSDSRASTYIDRWKTDGTLSNLTAICGSQPYSGMSLPILCWLAEKEPDTLSAAATVFSCKDWIKYKLTGIQTTDITEVDVPYLDSDSDPRGEVVFDLVGLDGDPELLPEIVSPTDVVGTVTSSAEATTGVPEGTPVVGGVIDNVASAFGSGASDPSDGSIIVGTSIITQALLDESGPGSEELKISTGVDGMSMVVVGSRAGIQNLEWAQEMLAGGSEFETIESMVREIPIGCDGVRYLPYLSATGEDGTFVDPAARAQFIGLEPGTSAPELLRSVYEGVALAVRDCFEYIRANSERVYLSGGGSRSAFWSQMFADCLETDLIVSDTDEPGAKGAALLAGIGVGIYNDIRAAVDQMITANHTHTPRQEATAKYDHLFELFVTLVDEMGPVWAENQRTRDEIRDEEV